MNPQTFLILDDSASERLLIQHVLAEAFPKSKIIHASDSAAALEICATTQLDCVLSDYHMPQMDGVAFAEELRRTNADLPVVLVTGVGDEMLVSHAIRRGVSDYIPKSRVSVASMRRTIERAIQASAFKQIIATQREELENFAYALAHDFKQPIRQIRTFTELIALEVPGGGSEDLQKYLTYLNQAALRLGNLVDVMSQYTLLNQEPELKNVDLNNVYENVGAALAIELRERGAALNFDGGASLHGNETLLAQVLQNLIVNGVKYNNSGAPRIDVSVSIQEQECLITVRDNGIGIEQQYLTDIFRPLVRLHTAAEYSGTGLGLTLARKAILAQRGTIWCESEVGAGSTFFVRMPIAQIASAAA